MCGVPVEGGEEGEAGGEFFGFFLDAGEVFFEGGEGFFKDLGILLEVGFDFEDLGEVVVGAEGAAFVGDGGEVGGVVAALGP